jgi:tetratricopeptide (TPR) repeat protein
MGDSLRTAVEAIYTRVTGDPARYAPLTFKLLGQARDEGDAETLVVALRARAWALHGSLDNTAARDLLDEAARIARRNRLPQRLGEVLVTRAITLQELGHSSQARRDLDRAGSLLVGAERADLLLQQAILDHNAGRAREAAVRYRQVLAEPGCAPVTWIKAANNLANALTVLGRPEQALGFLERAAELATDQGAWLVAVIAGSRAWSSFHAGHIAAGLRLFEEATALFQAADAPIGEHYVEYADALVDLRLLDEAARVARLAADDLSRHHARLMAAEALLRCSRLALALADVETARRDADAAVADLRRQHRTAWVARGTVASVAAEEAAVGPSLDGLRRLGRAASTLERCGLQAVAVEAHLAAGRTALALDRPAVARRHLTRAGDLAQGQAVLVRLRGRLALALLAEAGADPDGVLKHCRAGLRDLVSHRSALPSVELRVLASGHGIELGAMGLRALLGSASPAGVFTWLERTRAVSLLFAEPTSNAVDEDLAALRSVEQQLRAARREQGAEPQDLVRRQGVLETRIRRRSWARDHLGEAGAAALRPARLRQLLAGRWLVEFAVIDDRLIAVVVGPRQTRMIELGDVNAPSRDAEALLFGLRGVIRGGRFVAQARQTAEAALAALADRLIRPLGVPAEASLVIVPCAPLQSVLWSGLRSGVTSVAPSATVWARSRERASRQPDPADQVTAAVAGPGLSGAVSEVLEIAALHPRARQLMPPASTVEATLDTLRGADLVHLACHGHLRSDNPLFSALQLADGSLTLYELMQRGVSPRRLVMAVCESAVEREYAGGEVLGFVSALMAQGTAGVVASGIDIPDGAAVALMIDLHRHLAAGLTLDEALHRSRADCDRDDLGTFVAWCGLTAYGAA